MTGDTWRPMAELAFNMERIRNGGDVTPSRDFRDDWRHLAADGFNMERIRNGEISAD